MVEHALRNTLDALAERYIPKGTHKLLHVDSREAWTELMVGLLEAKALNKRLTVLTKCAVNWELLLLQKLSMQN